MRNRPILPWLFLTILPVAAHLPALSGRYRFDPIYLVSGLTPSTWQTNGLLHGYPWLDANAGVTSEALGALAAHDWLAGIMPWWNPYSGVGMPLAAEGQTPALFLPFVLLLALPHGLLALRMVLMALAGCFSFALLRRLRVATLPACAGAALFELNGTFAWLAHGPMMPMAFLPLILLGVEQARAGGLPVAIAAGVGFSFLAGFPETATLNLLLATSWGALRFAESDDKRGYALRCITAAIAGLLIAAPAIWPFLEALPRGFVGKHAGVVSGSLVAANVGQAVFPTLLGNPHATPGAPAAVIDAWQRTGGYVPIAVVGLALAALRRDGPDRALRWVLAAFVAVTAARASGLAPAMALFGEVPLLRQAALHTYIWPAWSMAASVLAALALQDWRDGRRPSVVAAALAGAGLAIVAVWLAAPATAWLRQFPPPLYQPIRGMAGGMLIAAVALALLRGAATRGRQILAAALLCGQSAALFAFWLLAGTHGRAPDTGAIRFLQSHLGLGRIVTFGPLVPNYGAMFGLAELAYNALPVPDLWVRAARDRLQPDSNGVLLYDGDLPDAAAVRGILAAAQALGAAYAVTWPGETLQDGALAYAGAAMNIWALGAPAPYAEAPGCTLTATSRTSFTALCPANARLLRRELFDPGWRADVNGGAVALARTDIFQSIPLPAGASTVRFSYAPPGMTYGWAACATGVLLIVGAQIKRARRKANKAVLF